jgi:hypothetical protein
MAKERTITDLLQEPTMAPAPAKNPPPEPHSPDTELSWICSECAEVERLSIHHEAPMHRHGAHLVIMVRYNGTATSDTNNGQ